MGPRMAVTMMAPHGNCEDRCVLYIYVKMRPKSNGVVCEVVHGVGVSVFSSPV